MADLVYTERMSSSQKGIYACAKVQQRVVELSTHGHQVEISIPTNPSCRYDMVIEWCNKLYRVQVKYAGGVRAKSPGVAVVTLTKGERGERRYLTDEIDVLLVYVSCVDKICWFEPNIWHDKTGLSIRYEPTKNGQSKNCILLEDYVW